MNDDDDDDDQRVTIRTDGNNSRNISVNGMLKVLFGLV